MVIQANRSTAITIDGNEYLYFGGTNYLGITNHPDIWQAAESAFKKFGFSSAASRLTSGETQVLLELETNLAEFTQTESALVLPAGFMTNRAVVDALDRTVDAWVVQSSAHGSIRSALSGSDNVIVVDDLVTGLQDRQVLTRSSKSGARLGIFAEPIDPRSGSTLDVGILCSSVRESDYLILDEAHSLGVLGATGKGAFEHFSIPVQDNLIRTGTLSKAFGTQGGFIVGSAAFIDTIKEKSDSFRLSTPLSPVACAAAAAALGLVKSHPQSTIRKLHANIEYTNKRLMNAGQASFAKHFVPIYCLASCAGVGDPALLMKHGIYVPSVKAYFADLRESGLRWTIQASHSSEQLDRLLDLITKSH